MPHVSDIIGFYKHFGLHSNRFSNLMTYGWLFPSDQWFNISVSTGWSHNPPLFWDGCWVYASLVLQVSCQGLLVCSSLTRPLSAAAKQRPCQVQKRHYMVNCDGGNRHAPRACICCACITGTITITTRPASQVVRYYAHIKHRAFIDALVIFFSFLIYHDYIVIIIIIIIIIMWLHWSALLLLEGSKMYLQGGEGGEPLHLLRMLP